VINPCSFEEALLRYFEVKPLLSFNNHDTLCFGSHHQMCGYFSLHCPTVWCVWWLDLDLRSCFFAVLRGASQKHTRTPEISHCEEGLGVAAWIHEMNDSTDTQLGLQKQNFQS